MGHGHDSGLGSRSAGAPTLARRTVIRRAVATGGSAALAALLAACGASATATPTRRTATASTAPRATTPATPAGGGVATPAGTPATGATRPGVTDREVKLGTWGPQDGPAGVYGVVSRAIAAYFKRVNAEGGIAGRTITVLNENDSYQPSRTATVVKKLVEEDQVFAMVGGLGTLPNLQVLDYLVRQGVPSIAPVTGSSLLARPTRPGIFCVQPSYTIEATLLARYALDTLGAKKLAIFYQDDQGGQEGRDAIQAELRRRGLSAAAEASYGLTDRNYNAQALRLATSGAEAIILYAVPLAGGGFLQELAKSTAKPRVLASSLIDDPALFTLAGAAIDGLILGEWLPDYADTANPKIAAYRTWEGANLPNEAAHDFAALGYTCATIMAELLRRVGADLTRERLVATANALQGYTGSLLPSLSYTPDDHQGRKAIYFRRANFADKAYTKLSDYVEYQ